MIRIDEKGDSARIALWYRDTPVTLDLLAAIEDTVTKSCRFYLIGVFCRAERNERREIQPIQSIYEEMRVHLGYNCGNSLKKLINYADAIEHIIDYLPNVAIDILNGITRLSIADTISLAKLDFQEINNVISRLSSESTIAKIVIAEQKALRKKTKRRGRPKLLKNDESQISVKDMPVFDPDAQINGLSYTIPSWVNMIEKAFNSGIDITSATARDNLASALSKLSDAAKTATVKLLEAR